MLFKYLIASFLPFAVIAGPAAVPAAAAAELLKARTLNGRCSGSSNGGTATGAYLTDGICVTTSTCSSYSGSNIVGGCPNDPNNVRCCVIGLAGSSSVNPCGGISYCTWTSNACSGTRPTGK